jgi:hypothetical protein
VKVETAAPEAVPSLEDKRRALVRKIAMLTNDWRLCPRPLCRRARACRLPDLTCYAEPPHPPMTPEQEDRAIARFQRALKRRMAEFGSR